MAFDASGAAEKIVLFLGEHARAAGAKGFVVGLSGGVDSATVAGLCAKAAGKENVLGISMPFSGQDSADAKLTAQAFGIKFKEISITPVWEEYSKRVDAGKGDRVAWGNLKARIRASVLYLHSNSLGYLVAGTGNKSECLTGYFTKFGDGAVDLLPVGGLYKWQVRLVAQAIGVPEQIIDKPPSAGLWEGQTDEGELGITYKELDAVLECLADRGLAPAATAEETSVDREKIDAVVKRMQLAAHKLAMPPVCSFTETSA